MFAIISNISALILVMCGADINKVRIIGSIGVVALWIQLFFWFRLFDSLAQYVDLIFSTVSDISKFMYVLLTVMLMFGSGL